MGKGRKLRNPRRAVVARVQARVVQGAVNRNPVGAVDPTPIATSGAAGEGRCDLDPTRLFPCDISDLGCYFGEILIPTEDQGDIIGTSVS